MIGGQWWWVSAYVSTEAYVELTPVCLEKSGKMYGKHSLRTTFFSFLFCFALPFQT